MRLLFAILTYTLSLCLSGGGKEPVALVLQKGNDLLLIDSLQSGDEACFFLTDTAAFLEPGQYAFIQHDRRLFHFLVSELDTLDFSFVATIDRGRTTEVRVTGSPENEAYFAFLSVLQDYTAKMERVWKRYEKLQNLENAPLEAAKRAAIEEIEEIELSSRAYCSGIEKEHEGQLLGIIAANVYSPAIPKELKDDAAAAFRYARLHYLDNVRFADSRILNTGILPMRLDAYFNQYVSPAPDSVSAAACALIDACTREDVKGFCAYYLLSRFLSSERTDMDGPAWEVANRYFINGNLPWKGSEEEFNALAFFVDSNKDCLPGHKAAALSLPDADGKEVSLMEVESPFTLIFFYEDACAACSREILKLKQFYEESRPGNLKVYAVYTQANKQAFENYTAFFPKDWISVWDPGFHSGFEKKYGVITTPKLYLLDEAKNIVGKNITTEQLPQLLNS